MKNDTNISLIEEAKKDFDLFHDNFDEYKSKVDSISELFNLKGEAELRSDYLPTYFVGDLEGGCRYGIFSINPGFSEESNQIEEPWKEGSWEDYLNFTKNFFTLFYKNNMKSRYYIMLAKIFSGLDNVNFENNRDYYQNNVINVDLIPYHSKNTGLPSKLNDEQKKYLQKSLSLNLNLLKDSGVELIIFNGKPLYRMLIEEMFVVDFRKVQISEKVDMYSFRLNGTQCILFEKFITSVRGLTNYDFQTVIPDLIRGELNQGKEEDGDENVSKKCTTNYLEFEI